MITTKRHLKRPFIESIEAVDAKLILEDRTTLSPGVSLKLSAGEKVRLSRKRRRWVTPLMRSLAGLTAPVQGKCLINGLDMNEFSFEEFNPYRAGIGFGFADTVLLSNRTLRENLQLPCLYNWDKSPAEVHDMVEEIAEFFVIKSFLDLRPWSVPPGFCKVVSVARAFMRSPQFVILDDPFVGLEYATQELLMTWLDQVIKRRPELTILIATDDESVDHQLDFSLVKATETITSELLSSKDLDYKGAV